MQVDLNKRFPIPSPGAQAWAVLSDVRALSACMPGAQIVEQVESTRFKGTVRTKVGPAAVMLAGDIEMLEHDLSRRRVRMAGRGADKAGSSASMELSASLEPDDASAGCVLVGQATITLSGRLAQVGGRQLTVVSDALLAQFADNFRNAAAAVGSLDTPTALAAHDESTTTLMVQSGQAPGVPIAAPGRRPFTQAAKKELNPSSLAWAAVRRWWARLVGRSP
jgi:carbon monoxide dehydrogenase subunit G